MKRIKLCFLLFVLAIVSANAKSKFIPDITSFEIIKIEPHDSLGAKIWADLTFDNHSNFELSNIKMSLFIDEQRYMDLTVNPTDCFVLKKGMQSRQFTAEVTLATDVNPFLLLGLVKSNNRPAIKLLLEGRTAIRGGIGTRIKIERNLDDVDFGMLVKANLIGKSFNKDIKGSVTSFDLQNITFLNERSFEAELRLDLNVTRLPANRLKDRLAISNISGCIYLDDVLLAELQVQHTHVLEKGEKPYLMVIKGNLDKNYNPCMLLSFLKNKNSWPLMSFKGSLKLPYLLGKNYDI